jgi:hypothetical protein
MNKIALLSGVALLIGTIFVAPNSASAATAPVAVLKNTCPDGYLDSSTVAAARGGDSRVHGFANFKYSDQCGDKVTYFEGAGTSWKAKATALVGKVVSVAADSTGTYLLYIIHEIGVSELAVAKRANDGTITRHAVVAPVNESLPQDGRGSIVAKNGAWFAVWPQATATPGKYVLYQAETMFGGGAEPGAFYLGVPTTPASTDTHPVLTMAPDGQPQLFFSRAAAGGGQDLLLAPGAYGAWGDATRVAAGVTISSQYAALDASVTTSTTFLSWTTGSDTGDQVVIASGSPGAWRTSTPPAGANPGTWAAHIAGSGTTVYAAFGAGDSPPGGAYLGAKAGTKAWTTSDATTGIPGSIDTFGVAALIYNGSGKSTALIYSGHQLYAVNR